MAIYRKLAVSEVPTSSHTASNRENHLTWGGFCAVYSATQILDKIDTMKVISGFVISILAVVSLLWIFSDNIWDRTPNGIAQSGEEYMSVVGNAQQAIGFVIEAADDPFGFDPVVFHTLSAINETGFEVTDIEGRFANFGVMRQIDEVRSERVIEERAVLLREIGGGGHAEVNRKTSEVVALHRTSKNAGDELTEVELEAKVRAFLGHVYPNFPLIEPSLMFDPGMKGARLNSGNYFFRWNDTSLTLPDGLVMDIPPFLQVGITATGYIFSYENTLPLYQSARAFLQTDLPIPDGWYAHTLGDNSIILTRSEVLPDVGATEGYAYGEQIHISKGVFDGNIEQLEDWYYLRWAFEDADHLIRDRERVQIRGFDALRIESDAAGASGGVLRYFIFTGDQFHTLSLYPFDTSKHVAEFEEFVQKYAGKMGTES